MSRPVNVLSLFSGIGGLELGLERAGMTVLGQVEKDAYCQRVLAKHWPEVPKHDDVRTCPAWWLGESRPAVHVVAGGFPCQPVSEAGLGLAQQDPRWLWPAMADTISAIRPTWVIGENVPGLLKRGIDDVTSDLTRLGYRWRVGTVSACAMGAPHMRERVFVLAHTMRGGCHEGRDQHQRSRRSTPRTSLVPRRIGTAQRSDWRPSEPQVARVAHGIPRVVDRNRALGNAVVPQVAEHIGRLIMAAAADLDVAA